MSINSPLVSVVMGVYNGVELLPQTVESVLEQQFADFEFLIVNDGSSDNTQALLEHYATTDSRIRLLHKPNEGLTAALIDGCKAAHGDFIARIDVGDIMTVQRLEKQQRVLARYPDCHFVSSQVGFFGPNWEPLWQAPGFPVSEHPVSVVSKHPEQGLNADIPHHGSVMFRKSAYHQLGGYRREFYYGQDWDLWYRLAEIGDYYAVPEVLYKARLFPGAISMSYNKQQQAIAKCSLAGHIARKAGQSDAPVLEQARQIRPGKHLFNNKITTNGYYFIGEALRRNGNPECRNYFIQAIKFMPGYVKSYIRLLQAFALR